MFIERPGCCRNAEHLHTRDSLSPACHGARQPESARQPGRGCESSPGLLCSSPSTLDHLDPFELAPKRRESSRAPHSQHLPRDTEERATCRTLASLPQLRYIDSYPRTWLLSTHPLPAPQPCFSISECWQITD